ncbi:hypothetical protein [Pseudomonas sp. TNT2022 ID642]|uniref:hypothetical protein n=1 Tax=Pseudomonas sp. TNT2022 ID642 TaxID=2942632 RepID=UPI002360AC48|nr:hypothetical protein [Pseudomonas sp. TNT2022 ID642]MDD1004969.1 hypothetical protein [Pseudomonas sp. TNT2022 ID642]
MSDMERAQLLHSVAKNFNLTPEMLEELRRQIVDPEIKGNLARINSGLDVEDNYKAIFSALPWIKNINGIHQQQEEKHKAEYQAPDYTLLVEDSGKDRFSLFVEVKSVRGKKESCELMVKQKHTLNNYARDNGAPLLVAIYWERLGYWTHNCLENFGGKKKNKISWDVAIMNDMSHLLSDYTFMIKRPFYRKTVFSSTMEMGAAGHEKYGAYHSSFVGLTPAPLRKSDVMESSVIDAIFRGKEVSFHREGELSYLVEEFVSVPQVVKLSNWIVNFIGLWGAKTDDRAGPFSFTEVGRIMMVNLMHEVGVEPHYMLPPDKNKCTDRLIALAYQGTEVEFSYKHSK